MALLDLGRVSRTLVKLIEEGIKTSSAWPAMLVPAVGPLPPDQLSGDSSVGFYMYHLAEEAALKSQAWPGQGAVPVRFAPMALNLYFVLSAHSDLAGELGPYREQLLMGLAVKTLHDYPVVDDNTRVGGAAILDPGLAGSGNRLRISMRPLPPNEAVSYWTAGSKPLRLSVYYEVSVVLLEPEEPPAGGGRVLLYGISTIVGGQPRLDTSRSDITFKIPGESAARSFEAQPAQAAPGDEIRFLGTGLAGERIALLLRSAAWDDPVEADEGWGTAAAGNRVYATVRTSSGGRAILPGSYTAVVKVATQVPLPDGGTRTLELLSNQTPFLITPAISSVGLPSPTGVLTVTGATFQHPDLLPSAVKVYVGDVQLVPGAAGGLGPGQMAIVDATTLELRLPAGALPGRPLPLRVLVNGSESAPRWVAAP